MRDFLRIQHHIECLKRTSTHRSIFLTSIISSSRTVTPKKLMKLKELENIFFDYDITVKYFYSNRIAAELFRVSASSVFVKKPPPKSTILRTFDFGAIFLILSVQVYLPGGSNQTSARSRGSDPVPLEGRSLK